MGIGVSFFGIYSGFFIRVIYCKNIFEVAFVEDFYEKYRVNR